MIQLPTLEVIATAAIQRIRQRFDLRRRVHPVVSKIAARERCVTCQQYRLCGYGVSHEGSRFCVFGRSIAAGGSFAHCPCHKCAEVGR